MKKEFFFEGKLIPDAVEKAAAELGMDKDLMTYEVVTMPVKGIFGIGSVNAKIKVEMEVPDEKPAPAPAPKKPMFEEKIAKKNHPVKSTPKERPARPKAEPKQEIKVAPKAPLEEVEGEIPDTIKAFLGGALTEMGIDDAVITVGSRENNIFEVEVAGSKMGVLIGRRGETLDAMQYLISLVVNRKFDEKIKIVLDTENYRAKRVAALETLANKTAQKAIKYKKNIALEPMSPYERRIIHAALTGKEHITTFSVGSEPKRKVVISYED